MNKSRGANNRSKRGHLGRRSATILSAREMKQAGNGADGSDNNTVSAREQARMRKIDNAAQRYADLYDFAPIGYVSFDRSGRIEEINLAAAQLFGMPRERLIGMPFTVFVPREDTQIFLDHLLRCRASETVVETDLRLKNIKRKISHVHLSSTPVTASVSNGALLYQTAIVDLTERKTAEEALREKEAELETIVTQTPFMLVRCTRDLRYRYVSNSYAKMLGRTSEEISGKSLLEVMGREGLETIRPYIDQVLAGAVASYDALIPFKNKEPRFLHGVYVPEKNADGEIVGWIASIIDVTESKRVETAAMRLAALVQSSHDAVVAKDLNGIITDWNQSAERIFGYTAKEIIGKSILTLIPKDRHPEETEILRKIRRGESIEHYHTVRRHKNGKLVDVSLTISPVRNSEGKIIGVSKIARDITLQKQRERQLAEQARLLDLTYDAIIVRDAQDRIVYWNKGAQEMYGYTADEALGKSSPKLLQTQHPEPISEVYRKLERDNRWLGELVHRRKNGTKIVVMSHWAIDRDERRARSFVLESNTDITPRKKIEHALQRSKAMLEEMVEKRTQALRYANAELEKEIVRRRGLEGQILEISDREQEKLGQELHDGLCQQLTAIGFLARATALRLRDHRVIQQEDLERIAQLINTSVMDARNIARDLHKEEINAAEFKQALEDLVTRKIWRTPCQLDLRTEINIENDKAASELYRILREAIINANKHARASEIVLQVRSSKNDLIFRVCDDGVGLKKTKGHGLGFHIMKYRAESIGARLQLESMKKGGTRVTCSFPLSKTK